MRKFFAVALVVAASAPALAESEVGFPEWEASFRKCDIGKQFRKDETITTIEGDLVFVTITPADIPAIERGIAILKKCNKFWTCVRERNAGKKRRCRLPR